MKTHDIKRIFKIAKKFPKVSIEYQTECSDSWRACGKLTDFKVERAPVSFGDEYYRLADIELVIDNSVYWAYGLEKFANSFIGFYGIGSENQIVYLRIIPVD